MWLIMHIHKRIEVWMNIDEMNEHCVELKWQAESKEHSETKTPTARGGDEN